MEKNGHSAAVIKMMNYIDVHLQEPTTANELAKAAGYSQDHTFRIF